MLEFGDMGRSKKDGTLPSSLQVQEDGNRIGLPRTELYLFVTKCVAEHS